MFGRSGKNKQRHDAITAFLGAGAEYRGQFSFQGVARIDGGVIGDIVSDGTLVLGADGRVEGRIQVAELIASGRILGDVQASRRVVLHKCSNLRGNLLSPLLVMEDGAVFNGTVRMPSPGDADVIRIAEHGDLALDQGGAAEDEAGN